MLPIDTDHASHDLIGFEPLTTDIIVTLKGKAPATGYDLRSGVLALARAVRHGHERAAAHHARHLARNWPS